MPTHRLAVLFVSLCLLLPLGIAQAADAVPSIECSALVENLDNCKSTISTFGNALSPDIRISGSSAYSPLAVRMKPKHSLTVVVRKRPLEKIQVAITYNQVAKPDPLNTVLSQTQKNLTGLTLVAGLLGLSPTSAQMLSSVSTPAVVAYYDLRGKRFTRPAPPEPPELKELRQLLKDFGDIEAAQDTLNTQLKQDNDVPLALPHQKCYRIG